MDQSKIGQFIARKRKEQSLTQMQLAERLGVTDRAVSKWETGKSLPDASLMLSLCGLLHITVNDLLSGEVVSMENYHEKAEKNLLEALAEKEAADRRLLTMEVVIGTISSLFLFTMVMLASFVDLASWLRIALIALGFVSFAVGVGYCLKIEQKAGYYKCARCGHCYVPAFAPVLWAMHAGRTRYMKCPRCGKKSWQKKVIRKD